MSYKIPDSTRIGHVHLKVSDIERSLSFYVGILGFEITQRYGGQAVFISAGGYHHHIGLNTWYQKMRHLRLNIPRAYSTQLFCMPKERNWQ